MSLINVRGSEDVIDTDGVTLRFNPVTLWGVSSAERERLVRNVIIRLLETALSNAYQYRWTDKHYELRALWSDEQWIDLTFKYECAILSMRIAKGHAPLQHLDVLSSVPLAT